jgi:hypothetical protein
MPISPTFWGAFWDGLAAPGLRQETGVGERDVVGGDNVHHLFHAFARTV